MKGICSLREMARLLNVDPRLKKLCLIDADKKSYPRFVLSRFTKRVEVERLRRIIEEKVANSLKRDERAPPKRQPKGYSDREVKVGRTGNTHDLGYKLHLSIDSERILPLASMVAPANQKRNFWPTEG